MGLYTQDIIGAKASTKGLGPFAQRARVTLRNNITTQDIDGAQAGTVRAGTCYIKLRCFIFKKN